MMMRRRGPGLVGVAARTAVVVGTAGAVRGHQEQKQAAKQQEQQQQAQQAAPPAAPAEPAAPSEQEELVDQIEKLADMKAKGLLTDEEYSAAKARLLQ